MPHVHDGAFLGNEKLIAIGWLSFGEQYARGDVAEKFFIALVDLLVAPWEPAATAGYHQCELCRFSGGPRTLKFANRSIEMGARNLYVPASGAVFVVPSLIAHYIDAHGYEPPIEFQHAVLACPPMRSTQYFRSILQNGPVGFTKPPLKK